MNRILQAQRQAPAPIAGVPSPCNSICRMDEATAWCQGCARTLPEIAAWAGLDDEGKRQVWALLPERRRFLGPRFLGPQHEGP